MRHVVTLQGHGVTVHLAGVNSHSLCGQLKLTKSVEGKTYPVAADTDRPANCHTCHKALQMLIRRRLDMVPVEKLEKFLEEIT